MLAALPRGTILAWAAKTAIPKGWVICDGNNGTPDLRNRALIGAVARADVGTTVGDSTHSHRVHGNTNVGNNHGPWVPGTQFQRDGNQTSSQSYGFDTRSEIVSNVPPSTKVMFIMKA